VSVPARVRACGDVDLDAHPFQYAGDGGDTDRFVPFYRSLGRRLGRRAREFVTRNWTPNQVARRYVALIVGPSAPCLSDKPGMERALLQFADVELAITGAGR